MSLTPTYNPEKGYLSVVFQPGNELPSSEISDIHQILSDFFRDQAGKFLSGAVEVQRDHWKVLTDGGNPPTLRVAPGDLRFDRILVRLDTEIIIPIDPLGSFATIWAIASPQTVSFLEDPDIQYPGFGETSRRLTFGVTIFVDYGSANPPPIGDDQYAIRLAAVDPAFADNQASIIQTKEFNAYVNDGVEIDRNPAQPQSSLRFSRGSIKIQTEDYAYTVVPVTSGLFLSTHTAEASSVIFMDEFGNITEDTQYPNSPHAKLGRVNFDSLGNIVNFRDDRDFESPVELRDEIRQTRDFNNLEYLTLKERLDADLALEYSLQGEAVFGSTGGVTISVAASSSPTTTFHVFITPKFTPPVFPQFIGDISISYDLVNQEFTVFNTGVNDYTEFDWFWQKQVGTPPLAPPETILTIFPSMFELDDDFLFTVEGIPGTNPVDRFQYRLDGGLTWTEAVSGMNPGQFLISGLAYGMHSIEVRGVDSLSNPDTSPATALWERVVSMPYNTIIVSAPSGLHPFPTATITASAAGGNVPFGYFEYKLDASPVWVPFIPSGANPDSLNLTGLLPGIHTIEVRAADIFGIVDTTPDMATWSQLTQSFLDVFSVNGPVQNQNYTPLIDIIGDGWIKDAGLVGSTELAVAAGVAVTEAPGTTRYELHPGQPVRRIKIEDFERFGFAAMTINFRKAVGEYSVEFTQTYFRITQHGVPGESQLTLQDIIRDTVPVNWLQGTRYWITLDDSGSNMVATLSEGSEGNVIATVSYASVFNNTAQTVQLEVTVGGPVVVPMDVSYATTVMAVPLAIKSDGLQLFTANKPGVNIENLVTINLNAPFNTYLGGSQSPNLFDTRLLPITSAVIKPDGSRIYILVSFGAAVVEVVQLDLGAAWNLATVTAPFNGVIMGGSFLFGDITYSTSTPHGMIAGDRVLVTGVTPTGYNKSAIISLVPSTTSFTVSSLNPGIFVSGGSYMRVANLDVTSQHPANPSSPRAALAFSSDGFFMFLASEYLGRVYRYTLAIAWDVETAVLSLPLAGLSISTVLGIAGFVPQGLAFNPVGSKMYLLRRGTSSGDINYEDSKVYEINLAVNWDITTATHVPGAKKRLGGPFIEPSIAGDSIQRTIVAASVAMNVATYTTSSAHGFSIGFAVRISDIEPFGKYNGAFLITATTPTTFQVAMPGASPGTYQSGGLVIYSYLLWLSKPVLGFCFNPLGTKVYAVKGPEGPVMEYNLSVPYDIATAVWRGYIKEFPENRIEIHGDFEILV